MKLKAMRKFQRRKQRGNALMEYVVPMSVILLTAGVLATVLDIQGILGQYFASASGQSGKPSGNFVVEEMGFSISGALGNGGGGFSSFGTLTDGDGQAVP